MHSYESLKFNSLGKDDLPMIPESNSGTAKIDFILVWLVLSVKSLHPIGPNKVNCVKMSASESAT